MLSIPHLVIIFIVVLVVFGPHKLPELARSLGKMMAEFRKASTDFRLAFEEEMRGIERQAREAEWKKAQEAAKATEQPATLAASADTVPQLTEPVTVPEPTIMPVGESVARESHLESAPAEGTSPAVSPDEPATEGTAPANAPHQPPAVTSEAEIPPSHDHRQSA